MNTDILEHLNMVVCISDDSGEVIYVNQYTKEHLGLQDNSCPVKSCELLIGDDVIRGEYRTAFEKGELFWSRVLPEYGDTRAPAFVSSSLFESGDKRLRFDIISPMSVGDTDEDYLYTMLFESAYLQIETPYRGIDYPEENILECLTAALNLYQADRAFILELDEELDACQLLFSKAREEPETDPDDRFNDAVFSGNLFSGFMKKGEPFLFTSEQLGLSHPLEYKWLLDHKINNMMAVPFTTRTALVAFFCVTNVGRFWNKTSFLTLSTKALANEIRAMYMRKLIRAAKYKSSELSDDDIVINLFGGFEINTNIGSIDFTDLSSLQCSRFLLYLLKNRSRTIPVREIADVLWPDQLIDNPYNMVKGVAFRVRKILDDICPKKLVVAKSGSYAINDQLTLILDTEVFDRLSERLKNTSLTDEEKQQIYESGLRVYKGDMLPSHESEIWLLGWIAYYQIKYLEFLKDYLNLLSDTGQYVKLYETVSNVLTIGYDDSDIHASMIDALLCQNKTDMAKSYYMRVEKYLSPDRRKDFMAVWNEVKANRSQPLSEDGKTET